MHKNQNYLPGTIFRDEANKSDIAKSAVALEPTSLVFPTRTFEFLAQFKSIWSIPTLWLEITFKLGRERNNLLSSSGFSPGVIAPKTSVASSGFAVRSDGKITLKHRSSLPKHLRLKSGYFLL